MAKLTGDFRKEERIRVRAVFVYFGTELGSLWRYVDCGLWIVDVVGPSRRPLRGAAALPAGQTGGTWE